METTRSPASLAILWPLAILVRFRPSVLQRGGKETAELQKDTFWLKKMAWNPQLGRLEATLFGDPHGFEVTYPPNIFEVVLMVFLREGL
jgi:hypothetical protein